MLFIEILMFSFELQATSLQADWLLKLLKHNFGINAHNQIMCVYTKATHGFLILYNHSQLAVLVASCMGVWPLM